jgi:hypothetical protein
MLPAMPGDRRLSKVNPFTTLEIVGTAPKLGRARHNVESALINDLRIRGVSLT